VCFKERSQQVADANFLAPAIDYFRKKAPSLQLVILTGEPDKYRSLKELFKDYLQVYSKGREEKDMLTLLKEKAQDAPREKVIRQHIDVFDVVEKWLGMEAEDRLISCLDDMTQSDPSAITGTLGNLRKLQEYFYVALNKIDNKMVPDQLIKSDRTKIENEKIIRHLKGNYNIGTKECVSIEYIKHNSKEDRLLNFVYRGCSEEIHLTDQNTTKYTVQSLVYAFMDLVLWLGKIGEAKNFPSHES